ncbi:MAG TPA: hypothetical protein VHO68_07585, partial [Bacteroidales bacterium]|nr:hypothetical protein [Bacteroidales bacterium]
MKIKLSICLFFILALTKNTMVFSQQEDKIVCLAQVNKDSIVLRWVPASIPVWQMGVKYGYIVERFTIAKGGQLVPDGLSSGKQLITVPLRPLSNEAFDELIKADSNAAVVQEAIYGTDFQPLMPDNNFQAFMKSYNDLEVRFGFALFVCDLSPRVAQAAGLRFVDKEVVADERYAYRISLVNVPEGMVVEPAVVVLDAASITKLPPVTDVRAIFLDKIVKLQWPVMLHKGIFSAYVLEKSTDGTNYKAISDLPLINASEKDNPDYFVYTDSLIRNDELTWYRIKGVSPFGEEGPASEPLKGQGRPEFSAYGTIDTAHVVANRQIVIHWRATESKEAPITGFQVLRAFNPNGIYELLTPKSLSPITRTFTDNKPGISNYYKIVLLGKDNRKSESFPYLVQTEDNDPPSSPQMLTGKVDSFGIVTIAWKSNNEPDISGYKVFRANAPFEEFISLSKDVTPENHYRDTINLNTLTSKIYYKVVAVDKHYNNSEYSTVLELTRPDTIRPAPAMITRIESKNGRLGINMEASPSEDIDRYELFRCPENDTVPIRISIWKGNLPATYEDIPLVQGIGYEYTLHTFDFAGNSSRFNRKIFVPATTQKSINLKAVLSKNGKSVVLSWDAPEDFQPIKTIIYRSKATEPLSILSTLDNSDRTFEDKDIEISTLYTYRIKITGKNGQNLISTSPATIKFR